MSHSVGFGFQICCTEDIVEKKCEYFIVLTSLHVIFKFLVFNAVKQGFFLAMTKWLESFNILLL